VFALTLRRKQREEELKRLDEEQQRRVAEREERFSLFVLFSRAGDVNVRRNSSDSMKKANASRKSAVVCVKAFPRAFYRRLEPQHQRLHLKRRLK
jgi:hypothetical protein